MNIVKHCLWQGPFLFFFFYHRVIVKQHHWQGGGFPTKMGKYARQHVPSRMHFQCMDVVHMAAYIPIYISILCEHNLMCLKLFTSCGQLLMISWTCRSKVNKLNSTLTFVNPKTKTLTLVCQKQLKPRLNSVFKFPRTLSDPQIDHLSASQRGCFLSSFFFAESGWFNINRLVLIDKMTNQIQKAQFGVKWYEWKK